MERNMACLLSGGLDSSLISALVSKFVPKGQLQTYSIGMSGGSDLEYARMVSKHIHSNHTEIILTEHEFFMAIPEVIYNIESYDTTTVRASVGNYLVSKYIAEHSDAKVIFNGDGSDELTGGYMYFHNCPSDIEFDYECKRLLNNLQYYDVLRSDRSISCHGLEPRTPFLDRTFVHTYLSLPINERNHNHDDKIEKYLLRQSVAVMDPYLLPRDVLWRTKEAFSDGVSSQHNSWYEIIQAKLSDKYSETEFQEKIKQYTFNQPTTKEQLYYRELFESYYPGRGDIIPGFWMPQYCDATDASARNLDVYKKKNKSNETTYKEKGSKLTIDVEIAHYE
jgi:asparagine synthase (glutamine-hydrolysing)